MVNVLIVIIKALLGLFKKSAPAPAPKSSDFDRAFPWIIKWEGSEYENVPGDDGGPTKYGIDESSHPGVDIKNLTLEGAKAIYQKEWDSCLSAELSYPLDVVYFNYHVNAGVGRANKLLQAALGLSQDGVIGPASKAAISKLSNPKTTAQWMVVAADKFYTELAYGQSHDAQFLKGWLNRNADLRKSFLM